MNDHRYQYTVPQWERLEARALAAEAEVDRLREGRCPIGLDATPEICSAGHCYQCRAISAEHYNGHAKAEIVMLQAEIERLKAALFRIELLPDQAPVQSAKSIARAALEAKP